MRPGQILPPLICVATAGSFFGIPLTPCCKECGDGFPILTLNSFRYRVGGKNATTWGILVMVWNILRSFFFFNHNDILSSFHSFLEIQVVPS